MARASVFQSGQLGWEAVAGTAVPASVKPTAYQISAKPTTERREIRAAGDKLNSALVLTKEHSEVELSEGVPCYNHLTHLFAMVVGNHTETPGMTPGVWEHSYGLLSGAADDVLTATLEFGDGSHDTRVAGVRLTGITLGFNRGGGTAEVSAEGFATKLEHGVTMTANPTRVDIVPIVPDHITVYVDDTRAAIGTTATDNIGVELEISDRANPVFFNKRSQASYGDTVESVPSLSINLTEPADANAYSWLDLFRANGTRYVRIEAVGGNITDEFGVDTGEVHTLVIDFAVQVDEIAELGDEDDVFALSTALMPVVDDSGFTGTIRLVNGVSLGV